MIKSLKSLSKDKSIIVYKPDKGNGVVIVDKSEYISKIQAYLMILLSLKPWAMTLT